MPTRPLAAFTLVVLSTWLVGAQDRPTPHAAAARESGATITGCIVSAETGRPLHGARVTISAGQLTADRVVLADREGRFTFADVSAGRYVVKASRVGYVSLEFGQRRAFEAGRPIEVRPGETRARVDVALPRGGVIAGRILDDLGEPVAGARVSAFRSRFSQGKRRFDRVGRSVPTNDLGEYRLYALPPGSYAVGTLAEPSEPDEGYPFAPAYYPGTHDPESADRVAVGLGEEHTGINFVQPPGRVVQVSGTVVDARGRGLAGASVRVVDVRVGSVHGSAVRADGSFTLPNIAPGEYGLAVSVKDAVTGQPELVMAPLTVSTTDIDGLVVRIVPGAKVTGRVLTPDGEMPGFDPAGLRVGITLDLSRLPARLAADGVVDGDWRFQLAGVAGTVRFTVAPLPDGWILEAVRLNGRDVTDTPLDLNGANDVDGLEVVVTDKVTEIAGTVTDESGEAVHDYTVVAFAADESRWTWPTRFIRHTRADQNGAFTMTKLPAAPYLVAALDYVDQGEVEDPEFLESIRHRATKVNLARGDEVVLRLRLVKRADLAR